MKEGAQNQREPVVEGKGERSVKAREMKEKGKLQEGCQEERKKENDQQEGGIELEAVHTVHGQYMCTHTHR